MNFGQRDQRSRKVSAQLTFTCSKTPTETIEKGVKIHHNDIIDVVLVFLYC